MAMTSNLCQWCRVSVRKSSFSYN